MIGATGRDRTGCDWLPRGRSAEAHFRLGVDAVEFCVEGRVEAAASCCHQAREFEVRGATEQKVGFSSFRGARAI